MTGVVINEVRRGFYLDSVALMRLSRTVAQMDGVEQAALMVGTPANIEIMADAGLLDANGRAAAGGDLVIAIMATSPEAGHAALAEAMRLIDRPASARDDGQAWHPRTLRAAVKSVPDSNLALISVPGAFAAAEARKALRHGLHVMLFSDNVSLEDEVALKHEAHERGLLLMGPDCGTAIINGVPLAFANRVPRGDVGIIGASGTGTQEISCLIAQGGGGVSQAIGVGGRDMTAEVGGITTLTALDALDRDPRTRHIVIVAKPPAPDVAAAVVDRITESAKSFTLCFIGAGEISAPANTTCTTTLKAAAESALGSTLPGAGFDIAAAARGMQPGRRLVHGLYSGGTLCAEAQAILRSRGETVMSNAPIPGASGLEQGSGGHRMVDFGSDEYTRGRPHPMIDPSVRDEALRTALTEPNIGIVLLDVVIGLGAHEDPAGHLTGILDGRPADGPLVIASVTGTDADPQGRSAQMQKLLAAGVLVAPCNADAATAAATWLASDR